MVQNKIHLSYITHLQYKKIVKKKRFKNMHKVMKITSLPKKFNIS